MFRLPTGGLRFGAASVVAVALVLSGLAACGGSSLRVDPTPPPSSTPGGGTSGTERAQRIVDVQRDLGVDMHYSLPALSSSLSGDGGASCDRANDDAFHRGELQVAYQQRRETPDHWSRVEAGFIAGACPAQLPSFFVSLGRLGHAQIASRLAAELNSLGIAS